jgi:hypothetical protein
MFNIRFSEGKDFTGTYLSVAFRDGEGETENAFLADKFKLKGLTVEKVEAPAEEAFEESAMDKTVEEEPAEEEFVEEPVESEEEPKGKKKSK